MPISLQLGYPEVPKSITNPNVLERNALDVGNPMSFLTFIKTINTSFEPDVLQNYYNEYLKRWNKKKNNQSDNNQAIIVERYRNFIKDISLHYTTIEERKFLSQVDFNDPYDLEILIPFYSRKLVEISLYYNKKREDAKFEITRKKLKGSNFGAEKTITEITLNYLENLQDGGIYYHLDEIRDFLEIEIEELYDTYPEYFDQLPDPAIYDNKDLDYGKDIFLRSNQDLINEIFAGVSQEMRDLKEADDLFDNKRALTEKYIATDFYFLSTGSTTTDFVSGLLFQADKPSANFLNIHFPTTASTQRDFVKTSRQVGFFRPHKTSIVLIDGENSGFVYDLDALEPNSLYYFADPKIRNNNEKVITYIVDDNFLKRNFTSGKAKNQPIHTIDSVSYYGYTTLDDINVDPNLSGLFDVGYVHDLSRDIYGNIFGLVKDDYNFKQNIQVIDQTVIKSLLMDGHTFYDELYGEGFQFDYSAFDDTTYLETIRSGISSYTNSFLLSGDPLTLFFRYFTPYQELITPTETTLTTEYVIRDGAFFTRANGVAYDDTFSTDLFEFPDGGVYYFSELYEGGVHTASPLQRALFDVTFPQLTANFTENVRVSAAANIINVDGGKFTDVFEFDFSFDSPDYPYNNTVFEGTEYETTSAKKDHLFDRLSLSGHIYVKNTYNKATYRITEALSYLPSKYNTAVVAELSGYVQNFDLSNDVYFIETPSYLIVDKIVYDGKDFLNPKSPNTIIEQATGPYDKISSRYKVDNAVYYCILRTLSDSITSNNFVLYPEIYKYDLFDYTNEKIFPVTTDLISANSEFYTISGGDVRYVLADHPTFTHNSRNNVYNISFLLKDQNNHIFLQQYDFEITSDVNMLNHYQFFGPDDQESNIFNDDYDDTLMFNLSAGDSFITPEEEYVL